MEVYNTEWTLVLNVRKIVNGCSSLIYYCNFDVQYTMQFSAYGQYNVTHYTLSCNVILHAIQCVHWRLTTKKVFEDRNDRSTFKMFQWFISDILKFLILSLSLYFFFFLPLVIVSQKTRLSFFFTTTCSDTGVVFELIRRSQRHGDAWYDKEKTVISGLVQGAAQRWIGLYPDL